MNKQSMGVSVYLWNQTVAAVSGGGGDAGGGEDLLRVQGQWAQQVIHPQLSWQQHPSSVPFSLRLPDGGYCGVCICVSVHR